MKDLELDKPQNEPIGQERKKASSIRKSRHTRQNSGQSNGSNRRMLKSGKGFGSPSRMHNSSDILQKTVDYTNNTSREMSPHRSARSIQNIALLGLSNKTDALRDAYNMVEEHDSDKEM